MENVYPSADKTTARRSTGSSSSAVRVESLQPGLPGSPCGQDGGFVVDTESNGQGNQMVICNNPNSNDYNANYANNP